MAAAPAFCQGCRRKGMIAGGPKKPRWCRCKGTSGPYVAPPGVVIRYTFVSADEATFRERCRLASVAEREARDALTQRWVRCGAGWRELPLGTPKRDALEANYFAARKAMLRLQAACSHPSRCLFSAAHCDVCNAYVECNVEHHAHLVREIGPTAARRLAV